MSIWNLWLDDVRIPYVKDVLLELAVFKHTNFPTDISTIEWCTSTQDAIGITVRKGPPAFMYLDHDLGEDDTSMAYLKWLSNVLELTPPKYTIISANPVGAANIVSFMNSWNKVHDS